MMNFLNNFDLVTLRKVFNVDYVSKEQCVKSFDSLDDVLLKLFEIYSTENKPSTTIGGECVRALYNVVCKYYNLHKVVYRYYNYDDVLVDNKDVESAVNSLECS